MAAGSKQKHLSLSFALKWKVFTLRVQDIESNTSSSARTVQLPKMEAITALLTYA